MRALGEYAVMPSPSLFFGEGTGPAGGIASLVEKFLRGHQPDSAARTGRGGKDRGKSSLLFFYPVLLSFYTFTKTLSFFTSMLHYRSGNAISLPRNAHPLAFIPPQASPPLRETGNSGVVEASLSFSSLLVVGLLFQVCENNKRRWCWGFVTS